MVVDPVVVDPVMVDPVMVDPVVVDPVVDDPVVDDPVMDDPVMAPKKTDAPARANVVSASLNGDDGRVLYAAAGVVAQTPAGGGQTLDGRQADAGIPAARAAFGQPTDQHAATSTPEPALPMGPEVDAVRTEPRGEDAATSTSLPSDSGLASAIDLPSTTSWRRLQG